MAQSGWVPMPDAPGPTPRPSSSVPLPCPPRAAPEATVAASGAGARRAYDLERASDNLVDGSKEANGFRVYYPMWVMPLQLALGVRVLLPHQDLKLRGHITEFIAGTMVAIFVSHQWVALAHPDPDLRQFRILQQAFHNILSGSVHVQGDLAHQSLYKTVLRMTALQVEEVRVSHIWYDWFSCPQTSAADGKDVSHLLQAAIDSIPAYVNMAGYMAILAPSVSRQDGAEPADCDYHTWRTRSWCRLELFAWVLAEGKPPVMLIRGPTAVHFTSAMGWLNDMPGLGALSVESDRAKVLQVTKRMLEWKLQRLRAKEDLHDWRFLQAMRGRILQGLDLPSYEEVGVFLRDFEFASAVDCAQLGAGAGWTPLHYAAIAGADAMVTELVGARCDPNGRIREDYPPGIIVGGTPPLMMATALGTDACIRALLRVRADVGLTDSQGFAALMGIGRNSRASACMVGELLQARADLEQASNWPISMTALHLAAMVGPPAKVSELLDMRADSTAICIAGNALTTAALWNSGEVVRLLLKRGMDANFSWDTRWTSQWLVCMVARGVSRLGTGVRIVESIAMNDGSTPLMHAVGAGNAAGVRFLLSARADPRACNSAGLTATALAASLGYDEISALLQEAACTGLGADPLLRRRFVMAL